MCYWISINFHSNLFLSLPLWLQRSLLLIIEAEWCCLTSSDAEENMHLHAAIIQIEFSSWTVKSL